MSIRIPLFKPLIGPETFKAATDALELGWLGMGSFVKEFEERLAEFLGLKDRFVVAVNTGTSALHLAMRLAGVGPCDEVITASLNNIGDFQAIKAAGGDPVFCDIREDNLGIDAEKAAELVGPKTKAMIAMDYAGVPCQLDELSALANRHGLRVIHDAAHSFGGSYNGEKIGSFGDLVMFSFDPIKNITCIDGGALVVNTKEEVEQLHRERLLGMDQSASRMYSNNRAWTYDVATLGFRYHMANLHASIGVSQLKRVEEIVTSRREACRLYSKLFQGAEGMIIPQTDFEGVAPFIYTIRVLRGKRQGLIEALQKSGIETGIHWIPGHNFTLLKNCRRGDLSVTDRVAQEILTIPLHPFMDSGLVRQVASAILDMLKKL